MIRRCFDFLVLVLVLLCPWVALGAEERGVTGSAGNQSKNTDRQKVVIQTPHVEAVFGNDGQTNRICVGDGAGDFACSDLSLSELSTWTAAVGPLDCGSGLDIFVANAGPANEICLNDGTGSLTCAAVNGDVGATRGVVLGDFDDDGDLDAATANNGQENRLCFNDGKASFTCVDLNDDTNSSVGVAAADLDGVNGLDLVFANYGEADRVCLNSGSGSFSCSDVSADTFSSLRVALDDIDGTNGIDAVISTDGEKNRICLNNGLGAFTCGDVSAREDFSYGLAIADLDGANGPDVLFANIGVKNEICLNNGSGGLGCVDASPDVNASTGVALADVDEDGDLDALFANLDQENQVCLNDGSGSFLCSNVSTDTNHTRGVVTGVFGNTTSCAPANLVAYWAADLSAKDVVGSYEGVLEGGATFADGKAGQAFSFDGMNDQVTFTSFPAADNFTIEAWVYYVGTNDSPWATIYADGDHGLFLLDRRVNWYEFGNQFVGDIAIPAQEWHHIAITYDSNTSTFTGYVDGEADGTSTFAGSALPPGLPYVSIGGHDGWDVLDGKVDELSVYDGVLTGHEIYALYQQGCSGKCVLRDATPDGFVFNDRVDVPRDSTVESDAVTVAGIDTAVSIAIESCTSSSCEYSVAGGGWSSDSGTAGDGQEVRVRQTSSSENLIATDLVLTIGGVSDTFTVTTLESFTLTVTLAGDGGGAVTTTPPGIDCGSDCVEPYDAGTQVKLTARPDSDSVFAGWSGDSDCDDATAEMVVDTSCIATFNRDHSYDPKIVDLVFANEYQENRICLNDGVGGLSCTDISTDARESWVIALGPIDCGNGIDMVIANQGLANGDGETNRVCLNDGAGSFTCRNVSPDENMSRGVVLWDFDGDDDLDAAFANNRQRDRICLNEGAGVFSCSDISEVADGNVGVARADIDGINGADLVFANWGHPAESGGVNRLCLNDGSGGFSCGDIGTDADRSLRVVVADLDDQDGLDIVFSNEWSRNRVCLNDGSAVFSCADLGSRDDFSRGLAIGDVDGSGGLDIVIANEGQTNRLCLNDGTASFSCGDLSPDVNASSGVALTDIDGDNDLDVVLANTDERNQLCINTGTGSFTCSDLGTEANRTRGVVAGVFGGPIAGLPPGMVAYWPANGSGDDVVGVSSCTLDNGVAFESGVSGKAFSFDAVDDQVALTNFPVADSFTVEGWVSYQGTNTPPWATIYADPEHGFFLNDGRLCWYDYGAVFIGELQLSAQSWHHVAITYDATSDVMTGFIDGVPDATAVVVDQALPPGMPTVYIGGHDGWDVIDGLIDDLAIYNRALSANEISTLHATGCGGKRLFFKGHFETGLADRWSWVVH